MRERLFFRRRLLPICLLCIFVLAGAAHAEAARIMPLGDSITYGTWGYGDYRPVSMITGYRQPLFLALQKAGHSVEFVGTLAAGGDATPAFDPRHEGHGGWRDDQLAANVHSWLSAHPADIVLLHIGTNSLDASPGDVERILDEIDRFSRDTIVLLARIINRKAYSAMTTFFNDNVEAMARARIANGDRIVLVDMEAALDYGTDMYDNLHPNQAGYDKMAKVWLAALLEMLPLPTRPQLAPMPTVNAWLDRELRLQLRATGSPAPTFSLSNPPTGMSIDGQSGLLKWRPNKEESRTVTVRAGNIAGSASLDLKLRAREAPWCPEELTALWPLDEEIAPYFELFHRTPIGGCAGKCPTPAAGRVDGGQVFAIGKGIDLSLGAQAPGGSFSLSFWLRRSASPGQAEQLLSGATGDGRWSMALSADGLTRLDWQVPGNAAVQVEGAYPLDDGDWHHLLAAFDFGAGELRLYLDGEENGSASGLGNDAAGTTTLRLGGADGDGVADFTGALDEVAIFHEALPLSAAERIHLRGSVGLGVCRYAQELPTITSTPPLRGTAGQQWRYQATASGQPQPLFTLAQGPPGMSLSVASGHLSWTPTDAGIYPVTIWADNLNGQAEQKFTLDIEPPPTPPTFRSTPAARAVIHEAYAYAMTVDGYPAPNLALIEAPSGMTLSNGRLDWTPAALGFYSVTLRAENASGATEQSFTIQVEPPPAPPTIGSVPVLVATADLPWLYSVKLLGYPQPQLLLIAAPEGMVVYGEQLLWLPKAPGDYSVHFAAVNGVGRAEQTFTVQVLPPPRAPRILSIPPLTAFLGQSYSHAVLTEGYPAPEISLLIAPPGMTIDAEQRLHWRPTAAGRYPVQLRAQSSSGSAEQNFVIEVRAARGWHGRLDDWWRKLKKRWRKWF